MLTQDEVIGTSCDLCAGPCQVPKWVAIGNPERARAAVNRAHKWLTPEWKRGIQEQLLGIVSLSATMLPTTYVEPYVDPEI